MDGGVEVGNSGCGGHVSQFDAMGLMVMLLPICNYEKEVVQHGNDGESDKNDVPHA